MSLYDDFIGDYAFEYDFPFGLPCDTWVMSNGETIEVAKMSDAHIRNCMNMVGEDNEWYDYFKNELKRRKKWK